jgi:metal-sulfur cluster biosynthetic enzyme
MSATISEAEIQGELSKIIDPELGVSITQLKLIDRLETKDDGSVNVDFHLTAPFCPPMFALKIAQDIRNGVLKVGGVESVKVTLRGHYLAEAVNKQVNKPAVELPKGAQAMGTK